MQYSQKRGQAFLNPWQENFLTHYSTTMHPEFPLGPSQIVQMFWKNISLTSQEREYRKDVILA